MTKEITKAFILQEIQDKFKLRDAIPEMFSFSEMVIPTYSIEPHLRRMVAYSKIISVTGTGGLLIRAIPGSERWIINGYTVTFMAAGAYKVAGVYITRRGYSATFVYLDLKKNQTESYTIDLPKRVTLDPGDAISVNIDDYTSTADIMINIDYEIEEIR